MTYIHVFDGATLRRVETPAPRPLRWAAWRPDGRVAMLVGNGGAALLFDGAKCEPLATESAHNLRGVGWSPDGRRALLVGNRGAALLYEAQHFDELPQVTVENLRRVAWSPDGACALVVGNGGTVLRFDARTGALTPLPGDRAHTLRAVAWRPDGAYALIGGYASRHAGYPRPHALYRCDGRYSQALLATDDEDDAFAIAWRPEASPVQALILALAYRPDGAIFNKLLLYDGSGFDHRPIESARALLGAGWHPDGSHALFCGESGSLLRYDERGISALPSETTDNLVGPFWRPTATVDQPSIAIILKGPGDRVFTV